MDGLADEINGLFSDPQTSVLDTVLVRIGTLLRDDPERRADVETVLTDAHRNMHPGVQTHQSAFIALLALDEMRNVSKTVDTWTDLALRPVLKDTRVEPGTLAKAKALIVAALVNVEDEQHAGDYRRRIMQLYLLDAPSETLVTDSLDMAELEDIERSKRVFFKDNLTEVLVDFALQRPQAFCHSFYRTFGFAQWRLELLVLLRTIVANDDFNFVIFLESELLTRILLSLTVDNSASVITVGVTVLVMSLPHFAVHAHEQLAKRLPSMLVILARILGSGVLLWTSPHDIARRGVPAVEDMEDEAVKPVNGGAMDPSQQIHWSGHVLLPDLDWHRIELAAVSHDWQSPNLSCASHLFTYLYGIFPSNTAGFIRQPLAYVERHEVPCPFVGGWRSALNEKQLRARAMLRSRTLSLSPWTLTHDIETELTDHTRTATLKHFEIVDQIHALDISRSAQRPSPPTHQLSGTDSASIAASVHTGEPSIASTRSRISVRDMITTTLALKNGSDVEVSDLPSHWPSELALFLADSSSPPSSLPATEQAQTAPSDSGEGLRAKALRAVGILQRELLLLRNELNYQLFLKRGLLQNVERLQHDRNAAVRRDVELQHLRDMRKEYKSQVDGLNKQLKAAQLSTTQLRNNLNSEAADCNAARKDLRTQRGRWMEETNVLRAAKEQVDAAFAAQSARISELDRQVFQLVTEKKENEHKVARLVQYEEQIEKQKQQLLLWDNDVARYIYQKTKIQEMSSNYQVLLERLKTYKGVNEQLADENRKLQVQLARIPARVATGGDRTPTRSSTQPDYSKLGAEIVQLRASDKKLRDQVRELEMELAAAREWPAAPQGQTTPLTEEAAT